MDAHPENPRGWPVERLLAECRFEAFRGPGPGGQKRNKTSSAVRITHEPTGLSAIAMESRSQHANRARALDRLRHRLALELRNPLEIEGFTAPAFFAAAIGRGGRLKLSPRDERYLDVVGLVLDLLPACGGSVSDAASRLGLTTANLVDFIQRDEKVLTQVNRLRAGAGLRRLGGA